MHLANFIFVSYLKIHPAVHLNTSKARRHCSQKEKRTKFTSFRCS